MIASRCPSSKGAPEALRPPAWLLAFAFLLALVSTSAFLFEPEKVELFCREQFDVVTITRAAAEATPATVARWWRGVWIQEEMPYYRPVTSMLFLAEWHLFGHRYLLYSLFVSWPLHALNTLLLCALVYRLTPGGPRRCAVIGGLAAALFTVPYWGNQGAARAMLYWWPSQGDMLSLCFGLLALLAWDVLWGPPGGTPEQARLRRAPERCLLAPTAFLVLAILSKEMAYVVPGMAALLIWQRRHPARTTSSQASPGLPALFPRFPIAPSVAIGVIFAVTAVLWVLRRLFVPEALGFKWRGLYSLEKLYHGLGGPLGSMVLVQDWALPVAALGAAVLLALLARRGHLPLGVLAAGAWAAAAFQLLGKSWMRLFMAPNPWLLVRGIWYWFALLWLWRAQRQEPVLFVVGSLVLITLPLLHHGGVHYLYWPSAAWAMVNATAFAALWPASDCLAQEGPPLRPGAVQ